jgi:hypothetical protein
VNINDRHAFTASFSFGGVRLLSLCVGMDPFSGAKVFSAPYLSKAQAFDEISNLSVAQKEWAAKSLCDRQAAVENGIRYFPR